MTNLFILMMTLGIILNPYRAFSQEASKSQAAENGESKELSFSLSDSDFNSLVNPFLDQFPKPIEPVAAPAPNSVTTPTSLPSNQEAVATRLPTETPPTLKPGSTTSSQSVKSSKPQEITFPNFTINGLVWNTDKPQAIINSNVVSVGDSIEDSVIVDINQTGVEVLREGKRFKIFYK